MPELPVAGTRIQAERDGGHTIVGTVVTCAPPAIFISTPERIADGTALRLVWGAEDGAREAEVVVYPSARRGIVFAKIVDAETIERRSNNRLKPTIVLLVRVEPIVRPDGMSDPGMNGTIVDVSPDGVAFVTERRLPIGTAVTVGFRSRQGREIGSDVPGKFVRFEHRDPRFLVAVHFDMNDRHRLTIDEVLAACKAPADGADTAT